MIPTRLLAGSAALALSTLVPTSPSRAAEAAATPSPFVSATANIDLASDYRFRGIDQTWGKPALQGGADLAFADGLYAGAWASNVSGNSYPGGSLEVDLYAGYNAKVGADLGYTVGGYGYMYPGANFDRSACPSAASPAPCVLPSQRLDTFELNAGVSWKWIAYKLSLSATDYFGANAATGYSGRTRGTLYHDVTLTWPFADDWSLAAHVGHTDVKATYGRVDADYTDVRVTLARTFQGGWSVSAAGAGANNDRLYRPPGGGLSYANGERRRVNAPTLLVQVGRAF